MTDFQSFLFQSMHLIGLKEENNNSTTDSIDNKKKLNTIEEPPDFNRKQSTINLKNSQKSQSTATTIDSRHSSTKSQHQPSPVKLLNNKQSPLKTITPKKNENKKNEEEKEEEEVEKPVQLRNDIKRISSNNDVINQLQQSSMGNISICTTETFISTNSTNVTTSTNGTTSTNFQSDENPPQKYKTIAESDVNINTSIDAFPDPPKFDNEQICTESTDEKNLSIDEERKNNFNDNNSNQLSEKVIENKDVLFEICSLSSSINCLDQAKNVVDSVPIEATTTNIVDESFIDNNGYNNNMSNVGVINIINTSTYDCEREAKSPKPVAESISQRILKKLGNGDFSPLKSIFSKNKNTCNNSVSTNGVSSSSSSSKHNSIESPVNNRIVQPFTDTKSMESYLAKFEEEILRKAKTEILNECKMLNLKQNEVTNKRNSMENVDSELIKKYLGVNGDDLLPQNDVENLEKYNSLINRIRLNTSKRYNTLPLLYSYFNDKIDSSQISKWLKTIEKATIENEEKDINEKEMPSKLTSKQYLINKKRELMDKVAKKMNHKKTPRSSTVIESPQLYANIDLTETLPEIKKQRKKKTVKEISKCVVETPSEIINDGFYINDKNDNNNNFNDIIKIEKALEVRDKREVIEIHEAPKRIKKKHRTRSEVQSVEENNSLAREQFNMTLSDELDELFELEKSRTREKRHHLRKSSAALKEENEEDDEVEDVSVQKVNIRRRKIDKAARQDDHFYNEINEMELKMNTIKVKERKSEDGEVVKMKTLKNERVKPKAIGSSANTTATSNIVSSGNVSPLVKTVKKTSAAEHAKNFMKKPSQLLAKLKSPERKILYNEWFAIIKKMDYDPKFDLEALVRTRGRFETHDNISYRDRLIEQKLRTARSEPNFGAMQFLQPNSEQSSEDSLDPNKPKKKRKPQQGNRDKSRAHRTVHLGQSHAEMMKSESYCENMSRKWDIGKPVREVDVRPEKVNKTKPQQQQQQQQQQQKQDTPTKDGLKLTLHKSDVELIKEILKKKNKNLSAADLNALTMNALKSKVGKADPNESTTFHEDLPPKVAKKTTTTTNRRAVNEIISDNDGDHGKTPHGRTKPKDDGLIKKRRDKSGLKHESGASSSLIDDTKDEDTSLMSKCKNLTQICKTDGAKGLGLELSKMVKGSIGTKFQKFKENSKIMSKINEIGHSLDKKHGRNDMSPSHSPVARPSELPSKHHRNKKGTKKVEDEDGHIEKWMRNVKTAHRKTLSDDDDNVSEDDDDDDDDDEEDDEFIEESRFKNKVEEQPKKHHRRLSNINEDSNDNETIRRKKKQQDKQIKDAKSRQHKSVDDFDDDIKSSSRPAPPKRPPPPKPPSPEPVKSNRRRDKPLSPEPVKSNRRRDEPLSPEPVKSNRRRDESSTVHERLMRDMNGIKVKQNRKSNQSCDSMSAFDSPEMLRKTKPTKLQKPPPRPPSIEKKGARSKIPDFNSFEAEVLQKYSNTKRSSKSHETMASMLEYEIDAHTESHLKIPATIKHKREHHVKTVKSNHKIRSVSPSPERHRTKSRQPNHRHHSQMLSISPVERRHQEEKTKRKPPIHR
jgi:hypothetical protein